MVALQLQGNQIVVGAFKLVFICITCMLIGRRDHHLRNQDLDTLQNLAFSTKLRNRELRNNENSTIDDTAKVHIFAAWFNSKEEDQSIPRHGCRGMGGALLQHYSFNLVTKLSGNDIKELNKFRLQANLDDIRLAQFKKLVAFGNHLNHMSDDDIFIMMDLCDVLVQRSNLDNSLLKTYRTLLQRRKDIQQGSILFSSEVNCWPPQTANAGICEREQQLPIKENLTVLAGGSVHLNSGVYMGLVKDVKLFLNERLPALVESLANSDWGDDQGLLHIAHDRQVIPMQLDYASEIFQNLFYPDMRIRPNPWLNTGVVSFVEKTGLWTNSLGIEPFFIHGNGGTYFRFDDIHYYSDFQGCSAYYEIFWRHFMKSRGLTEKDIIERLSYSHIHINGHKVNYTDVCTPSDFFKCN